MGGVIAGWVCGYAMSILSTVALVGLAAKSPGGTRIHRLFPGVSLAIVAIAVSMGMMFGWTIVGVIIGSGYEVANLADQPGILGSPSAPFLLAMAALAVIPIPGLLLFWPRQWWVWGAMSAAFLALFGWLLPVMAAQFYTSV